MLEIGTSLREARRHAGLELTEVEAETMISCRYLEALEQERFELLPDGPYRRSFVREYARFLGLDPETYAREYELRFAPAEPDPPLAASRPGVDFAHILRKVTPLRAAFAGAVLLAGIGVWQLGGTGGGGPPRPIPAAAAPRRRTASRTPPASPSRRQAAPAISKSPSSHPATLVLTAARGDCWLSVQVGSGTGPVVYQRTLQQGQTVRFGLRKALWIRLGAPWNLVAAIGRHTITQALPRTTGDIVATSGGLRSGS